MTREQWKEKLPFIQAFANHLDIELNIATEMFPKWIPVDSSHEFVSPVEYYRIKPESKLRAWRPDEVPLPCVFKAKLCEDRFIALCVVRGSTWMGGGNISNPQQSHTTNQLLSDFNYSIDGGTTWHPCGVIEL